MARALQSLVVKAAARAPADHRRFGHWDCAKRLSHPQSGHDSRHVRDQALRQVADLGARVGDDLFALAVIELLRHFQCLAGRPASRSLPFRTAGNGETVQGVFKQTVQLSSGKFALVENAHEFTLVPWRPVIDNQLGREVMGVVQGGSVSWQLGRKRGLGL